jgi:hypothetical protein
METSETLFSKKNGKLGIAYHWACHMKTWLVTCSFLLTPDIQQKNKNNA